MRRLRTLSDVVDWRLCVGCGACVTACERGAVRMVHVESEGFRPEFTDPECAGCRRCLDICPGAHVDGNLVLPPRREWSEADHEFGPVLEIYEGWASDPEVRYRGSSGGVLSALSLYCLERGGFSGVVHAGMDPTAPWLNTNHVSRRRAEVLARAGSRYSPSAPCAALRDLPAGAGAHVFVGKPCDTSAVSALTQRDPELQAKVGLVLTFFCAGTPSTRGTLDLLDQLSVGRSLVKEVHYRGEGWPGSFRAVAGDSARATALSYEDAWRRLTGYRPIRCHLCPDGLGRVADIACGDAWHHYEKNGDPGRSLILVRTERGRAVLAEAVRAGYVTLQPATADDVLRAQPNLLARRRLLFGRMAVFTLFGVPMPRYKGFSLLRGWVPAGVGRQLKTVGGAMRRILQHGWYRRRVQRSGDFELAG